MGGQVWGFEDRVAIYWCQGVECWGFLTVREGSTTLENSGWDGMVWWGVEHKRKFSIGQTNGHLRSMLLDQLAAC